MPNSPQKIQQWQMKKRSLNTYARPVRFLP
jgi:hypothetical protein